jgi:hypothetical protein
VAVEAAAGDQPGSLEQQLLNLNAAAPGVPTSALVQVACSTLATSGELLKQTQPGSPSLQMICKQFAEPKCMITTNRVLRAAVLVDAWGIIKPNKVCCACFPVGIFSM